MKAEPVTKEKKQACMHMAQAGDKQARDAAVEENIGLVYLVLKRFAGRGHDMEELFQIGAIGLIKAVERFDASRGLAFSTYAVPMISGEIRRFLRDDGMLHVSRSIQENARKIALLRENIKKKENHEPTILELEKASGIPAEEIMLAMGAGAQVDSISRPVRTGAEEEGGLTLFDQLEDKSQTEERLIDQIAVRQLFDLLPEKERKLLELRYLEGKTQAETARLLGMNQVAVSRLEKKILLSLRHELTYNDNTT